MKEGERNEEDEEGLAVEDDLDLTQAIDFDLTEAESESENFKRHKRVGYGFSHGGEGIKGSVVVACLHGEGDYYNRGVIMGADTQAMETDPTRNWDDAVIFPGIFPKIFRAARNVIVGGAGIYDDTIAVRDFFENIVEQNEDLEVKEVIQEVRKLFPALSLSADSKFLVAGVDELGPAIYLVEKGPKPTRMGSFKKLCYWGAIGTGSEVAVDEMKFQANIINSKYVLEALTALDAEDLVYRSVFIAMAMHRSVGGNFDMAGVNYAGMAQVAHPRVRDPMNETSSSYPHTVSMMDEL